MARINTLRYLSWKRLRVQVSAICVVTLTLALGGVTATFISHQRQTLSKEYLHEARVLAENLSRSVVEWLLNEDYDKLSEAAGRSAEFSRVYAIEIYDPEGFPLSSIVRDETGVIQEVFSIEKIKVPEKLFDQEVSDDEVTTWVSIESENQIGWVKLVSSLNDLNTMNAALLKRGFLFLSVFLSLSVLVFWRFFDGPLKAIEEITEYASRMTGERVEKLEIKHQTRETEKLAQTLNATSATLHQNLQDLEKARDELSVDVQQKNQDLVDTIVELQGEIDERKKAQAQLLHAQKMESVGQLAAGIAHEINTPIQFISSNLNFIQESKDDLFNIIEGLKKETANSEIRDEIGEQIETIEKLLEEYDFEFIEDELPKAIEQSIEGTRRVSTIVQAMKTFSHPSTESLTSANINKIIEDTVILSKNEWKYTSALNLELEPELPDSICSVSEVSQVILNMIVNAAHAIEESKEGNDQLEGQILVKSWSSEDRTVHFSISDNGAGIPEDAQIHIFDPFFTTKEVGKGTGQGLSICYDSIVNRHKGNIEFMTEKGKGTTFLITLPFQDTPTETEAS